MFSASAHLIADFPMNGSCGDDQQKFRLLEQAFWEYQQPMT